MIQLRLGSFSFLSMYSICFIFFMLYFVPLARYSASDVGSCFQKSLHGVRTVSTHCTSVQKCPQIQFWRLPVFLSSRGLQSQSNGCEIHHETSAQRWYAIHGSVFGRLVPPSVALLLNSFRVPKTGWVRTPHENCVHKIRGQKINQHKLQIYDLHRCCIYQISCWNIYGQHLVIPGSPGTSGKMWE